MKFKLIEYFDENNFKAYMFSREGVLIPVNDKCYSKNIEDGTSVISVHPQIIADWIGYTDVLCDQYILNSLKWAYEYLDNRCRKAINKIISMALSIDMYEREKGNNMYTYLEKDFDLLYVLLGDEDYRYLYSEKDKERAENLLEANLRYIEQEFNQKFLRFRFGGSAFSNGLSDDLFIRVASVGYNWFDKIWEYVYNNRHKIKTVTIEEDLIKPDGSNRVYNIKGKSIDKFPVEDFIMLPGNPIVESLKIK